jgi:uncharacterized protein (TIGR03437 family)
MCTLFLRISFVCVLALAVEAASTPVVPPDSVVNNASFAVGTNPLAPGTIAAIFGSNLDDGSDNAFSSFGTNGALLTTLGGASVTFNGIPAPMFSAFPGQLNVQIPEGLGSATSASVVVTVGGQSSAPQTVPLGSFSPGLFSTNQKGTGQGAIQVSNTSTYAAPAGSISGSASRAVKPGEFITIYCTGLGAVSNPPAPGTAASSSPLSHTLTTPKVTIGGEISTVSFAGLSPGYVGLYQVNAQIPADASGGSTVVVELSIGGVESNTVTIAVNGPVGPSGSMIAGGEQHTCALTSAGAVLCWGSNASGQLGNGTTTKSLTPVPVTGLSSGVVGITAGAAFTCALTHTGTVMCWGSNTTGDLGNGTTNDSDVPVQVLDVAGTSPLTGVVAISAGQYFVCALTSAGSVLCWGDNAEGELGPEPSGFRTGLPYVVTGIPAGMVAINTGAGFACALTTTGAAWCWGGSGTGVLGGGPNLPNGNPVEVLNLAGTGPISGVAQISGGYQDACAVTNAGAALCWGANQAGEDGNATNTSVSSPVQVLDIAGTSPLVGVTVVVSGDNDACAITTAGGVLCWGDPFNGELGNNYGKDTEIPTQVSGLTSGVMEIAAGYHHNCAVLSSGGLMCWGFNINGQLGNGNTNDALTPVAVVGVGGTGILKLF